MPRAKITDSERNERKIKMLKDIGITKECSITSDRLFSKFISVGYTRYAVVRFVLEVSDTKGRRMHLAKDCNVTFDKNLKATITKTIK